MLSTGEASCSSVHGANRLGANTLLDLVVFGRRAAIITQETYKPGQSQADLLPDASEESIAKLDKLRYLTGTEPTAKIRSHMQKNNAEIRCRLQKTRLP